MRKLALRLIALAGTLGTLAACADNPTALEHGQPPQNPAPRDRPLLDHQTVQGCVSDGVCTIEPIEVNPGPGQCDPWTSLDWCGDGGDCVSSGPGAAPEHQGTMDCGDPYDPDAPKPPPSSAPKVCPDYGCPPPCNPATDPDCEQPLTFADLGTINDAIATYVRLPSEIADTIARRQCEEMLRQFNASLVGGAVFRGGTNTTHYGAFYNNRIHYDPEYLDFAAGGDATSQREIANTSLHEAAHVLGYGHPTPPTWVGSQDYYSDAPFNLLSPGPNSCIKY